MQIENLQEQLRDKEKQMTSLKERVKSLQADTSNTDTALTTLEEALAEKVDTHKHRLVYSNLNPSMSCCSLSVLGLSYQNLVRHDSHPCCVSVIHCLIGLMLQILLKCIIHYFLFIFNFSINRNQTAGFVFLSSVISLERYGR